MAKKDIILVIDNNERNRAIFETYLEMQGFSACFTENGEQAVKKTGEIMPDIILLNIMGPDPDEFRILENLRNDPDLIDIPVMILTVKSTPENVITALRAGVGDVLIKPFDVNEFIKKIKYLLQLNKNRVVIELKTKRMKKQNLLNINFTLQTKQPAIFQP